MDRVKPSGISRRDALRYGVAAAGALALNGCQALDRSGSSRPLAKVKVASDRVIRSVAGSRPFRPSGFVVRSESLGDRTVVHNYGHGGAGLTLCWGSSALAVEQAAATGHRRYAVLGCGALGLTTARLLQDRGFEATIYARELPPDTTSNIAGAQWSPFTVSDRDSETPAYRQQFERAARFAHRYYQNLVGSTYGVRWIENYILTDSPPRPQESAISDLFFAGELLPRAEHPFDSPYVRRFVTMLIEPPVLLHALTRDFLLRGGAIEVREFHEPAELNTLEEPVIVNCTGLGSSRLFGDGELIPIKGQLAILLPQPEVDYILIRGDYYMFPRSDGIVLGGTRDRGDWSVDPDPDVTARLVENHSRIFAAMSPR